MSQKETLHPLWDSTDQARKNLLKQSGKIVIKRMQRNLKGDGTLLPARGISLCWFPSLFKDQELIEQLLHIQQELISAMGKENLIIVPTHKDLTALHMTFQNKVHNVSQNPTQRQLEEGAQLLLKELETVKSFSGKLVGPFWDLDFCIVMAWQDKGEALEIKKRASNALGLDFVERPFHVTLAYPAKGEFSSEAFQKLDKAFKSIPKKAIFPVQINELEICSYGDIAFHDLMRLESAKIQLTPSSLN